MDKFIIEGGTPLNGEVVPSGNKNAALPLVAACLLTDEPVVLRNVPRIKDVDVMRRLIESLGAQVEDLDATSWRITARELRPADLDPDLCRKIRASILVAGPMSARVGDFKLPPPGGDVIGRRRLDTHILALQALGSEVEYERGFSFKSKGYVCRGGDARSHHLQIVRSDREFPAMQSGNTMYMKRIRTDLFNLCA